jgi:hypothetical protein
MASHIIGNAGMSVSNTKHTIPGKIDVRNWQTPDSMLSNNQTDKEVAA